MYNRGIFVRVHPTRRNRIVVQFPTMLAKLILYSVLGLIIAYFGRVWYLLTSASSDLADHRPGRCEHVSGLELKGSEDMTLLADGKLLITSGLDFKAKQKFTIGQVLVLNTNTSSTRAKKLVIQNWPKDRPFNPHGIHHYIDGKGVIHVFIVTHNPEAVARFTFDGKTTLKLTKLFEDDLLVHGNSVFAFGEDSFYVTNLVGSHHLNHVMTYLEFFLMVPRASILLVRNGVFEYAQQSLLAPNGIIANDRFLYAAEKGRIGVYKRHQDHTLSFFKSIDFRLVSHDNVKLDSNGDLWVGCQTVFLEMLRTLDDPSVKAHSAVLRIRDIESDPKVETVFADDGSYLSATTVAVHIPDQKKVYIGTVQDKMAVCEVNYLMK